MIHDFFLKDFYCFFLVFVRLAGLIMVMPAFSQAGVPPQVRTMLTLGLSFIITPLVQHHFPADYEQLTGYLLLVVKELCIGLFIGMTARILMAALDIAGNLISFQLSLSNATVFNPTLAMQGTAISNFFLIGGSLLIFLLDFHHTIIQAVIHSYQFLHLGKAITDPNFSHSILNTFSNMFKIGFQLSLPFLIVGTILQLSLGLLSKIVPQMQIFFVAMPLQIALGLLMLSLVMSGILFAFSDKFYFHFNEVLKL